MSQSSQNLPVAFGAIKSGPAQLTEEDRLALAKAVRALEHSNVATRIANTVGRRLGSVSKLLPPGVTTVVNRAAENAIATALDVAIRSLSSVSGSSGRFKFTSPLGHKALAAVSGAAGGMFGLTSLPFELPVSTIIILRSIAAIAREQGEDLDDPASAMACLQVFALGARDGEGGVAEGGYFATRALLAKTISEASRFVLASGLTDEAAPVLLKLISQIGSRFGLVVSEKLAAQTLPILGAAGGAAVNYAFAAHFQSLAAGHFVVRRLERLYGGDLVRAEYDRLLEAEQAA